ncbi:Hypothetical predicted protein, partial [Paramuricea clavata]
TMCKDQGYASIFVDWRQNIHFDAILTRMECYSTMFADIPEDDIQCFLLDTEANANTKKKTASDIALVQLFLTNEGETSAIEEIPPADLDRYLSLFLLSVRKTSGEEYEPTTLRGFCGQIPYKI